MEDQQDYWCHVQYLSATPEPMQLYPADVTLNSVPWHDAIWKEILRSPNNSTGEESSGAIPKISSTLDRKPPLIQSFLWLLCHPCLDLWLESTLEHPQRYQQRWTEETKREPVVIWGPLFSIFWDFNSLISREIPRKDYGHRELSARPLTQSWKFFKTNKKQKNSKPESLNLYP